MADPAPNNDPSTDPIGGPDSLDDVDSLLADAAKLADDLGSEVGTDQPGDTPTKPLANAAPIDLDANLDLVDQLLAETAETLGDQTVEQESTDPPAEQESTDQTVEQESKDQAPESPAPTADEGETQGPDQGFGDGHDLDEPAAETSGASQVAPDAAVSGTDSDSPSPAAPPDYLGDDSPAEHHDQQIEPEAPPATPKPVRRLLQTLRERVARPIAALLLDCLDLIDRPFTAIGLQVRIILGWVALATLLAAAGVLVITN